jgi:hypothetical protein
MNKYKVIKRSIIYPPTQNLWWNKYYAMLPTPLYLEESNIIRVFFGTSDESICSRISYVDLNANNPSEIVADPQEITLDLGTQGTFDDSGVVPSCAINVNGKILLYTVGFQRTVKVPYMLFAGLAVSDDAINFTRYSEAPILERTKLRPISQGAPSVLYHNGIYKMWHWFGSEWTEVNGKLFIACKIGYAESADAYNWEMKDITCLEPDASKKEFSIASPWVMFNHEENIFQMWYSIRYTDKLYRIAYAESADGLKWERIEDGIDLDVSSEGWDSEMVCYPAVVNVKGKTYMFYNGNDNGKTGFGYAEIEKI